MRFLVFLVPTIFSARDTLVPITSTHWTPVNRTLAGVYVPSTLQTQSLPTLPVPSGTARPDRCTHRQTKWFTMSVHDLNNPTKCTRSHCTADDTETETRGNWLPPTITQPMQRALRTVRLLSKPDSKLLPTISRTSHGTAWHMKLVWQCSSRQGNGLVPICPELPWF